MLGDKFMKNLTKSKIVMSLLLTLGIFLSVFSGIVYFNNKNHASEIFATDTAIEKPIRVQKVITNKTESDGKNTYTFHTKQNSQVFDLSPTVDSNGNITALNQYVTQSSENQTIKNNELIILDSDETKEVILVTFNVAELAYKSASDSTITATEEVENSTTSGYYTLTINAYLNNRPLKTNETIIDQGANDSKYYYQILDLDTSSKDTLYFSDGTQVDDIEGEYKFVFQYNKKENGNVLEVQTTTINFFVFNAETYQNSNNTHIEPKVYNTEKIARNIMSTNTGATEYNYFNYNNTSTTDYDNKTVNSTQLAFPTIDYDITKYSLRFKTSLYGKSNIYEYTFEGFEDAENKKNPILTIYKDGTVVSTTSTTLNNETTIQINIDDNILNDVTIKDNIASIVLSSISEYDITFNYVFENKQYSEQTSKYTYTYSINSQLSDDYTSDDISFVKKTNWDKIGNVKLYIFGYQLYYNDYENKTTDKKIEFKNDSQITDVTFLNAESNFTSNEALTLPTKDDANYAASTNQAPVTLSYYASMTLKDNKTQSYYKYWSSYDEYKKDTVKPKATTVKNITNNTRFTQNGYYQVFIEYNFTNYNQVETTNESGKTIEKLNANASTIKHYQYFSFAINNTEPSINVTTTDGDVVSSEGYTNKDVKITWRANSDFDITPRVSILRQSFEDLQNETGVWTTVYNNGAQNVPNYGIVMNGSNSIIISKNPSETLTVDTNGYYQIIINYGPGTQTLAKYRFTIDYQNISGLTTLAVTNQDSKNNTISYQETTSSIVNSAFALKWNEKQSGATISATYDFIGLEKDDSLISQNTDSLLPSVSATTKATEIESELSGKTINLFNGYKLSNSINKNIPYVKAVVESSTSDANKITYSLKDINAMCTNAGLYIFTLTDSAGNVAHKLLFVDNTKSVAYSFTNEQSKYVQTSSERMIASRDTIVIWGNNKAISVNTEIMTELTTNYGEYLNVFHFAQIQSSAYALLISNDAINVKDKSKYTGKKYTDTHSINNAYQVFYIKSSDVIKDNEQATRNQYFNYGEHIHNINVQNSGQITSNSNANKVFDNILNIELEMNGDNSLLRTYVTNSDNINTTDRVDNASATNKSKLYIEWYQNDGNDFEVKEISVYYFPLTFETNSTNYPYSSKPSSTIKIDLTNAKNSSINSGKKISSAINLENNVSLEGMYVIRREYNKPLDIGDVGNESDDYSPRYYLIFIDRNNIISYTSSLHLIGDLIGLNIGTNSAYKYSNYQVEFSGADFLTDTSETNPKFRTSKLPISWLTEIKGLNKFSSKDKTITKLNNETSLKLKDNEDTKYTINNQICATFTLNDVAISYKERQSDSFQETTDKDYTNFTKNGYYQVKLSDKAGNTFTFVFQVAVESPKANVAKYVLNETTNKNDYLFYTEGEENISTNQTNMIVGWNKPVSETGFDAEIDLYNFKVTAQFENGKSAELVVTNGNLTSNLTLSRTASLNIHDISTDSLKQSSKFSSPSWDYYLDFADIFAILPAEYTKLSANFEITLKYVGNEQDYANLTTISPNSYFYTIKNVVFDFNKPEYNFNRLLSSDLFLANLYENYDEFVNEFEDYNSEINFENYAFTVDKNFTLDQMIVDASSIYTDSNMDTYKMYIRSYNKYLDETIQNQQSLMPDDDRYDNRALFTNRYRFDENYMVNGSLLYTDISELYWNNTEHKDYTLEYILNMYGFELNTYYEIIEVDFAGNYRVYTIFVKDSLDNTVSKANFTGTDTDSGATQSFSETFDSVNRYTVSQDSNAIDLIDSTKQLTQVEAMEYIKLYAKQLELNDFSDILNNISQYIEKYIMVTINDVNSGNITSIILYPNGDLNEFISDINAAISTYSSETGNIYYITMTTSLGEVLKVEHRKPSKDYPNYTISTTSTGFTILFTVNPNDVNLSAYITNFNAYQAENGVISTDALSSDSNGTTIISDINEFLTENEYDSYAFRYTFTMRGSSGSEYYLKLIDNFGRELTLRQIIGVEDNQDKIVFSNSNEYQLTLDAFEKVNTSTNAVTITYTSGYASIKFQNVLNSLAIYKMELSQSGEEFILTQKEQLDIDESKYTKSINGIWTYPLLTSDTENNQVYKVIFTSTLGEEIYYIGYHNSLGEISIVNASDNSKITATQGLKATYDRTILISISNTNEIFPTKVNVTKQYLDSNNEQISENLGQINSGEIFSALGTYIFTAYNDLGTQLTFTITIEEKINNNYWVNYQIGGVDAGTLSPASQDKTILAEYGSFDNPISYFTIYDYELKTNTTNGYNYSIVDGSTQNIDYNGSNVGVANIYKVYKLVDGKETNVVYLSITKVVANSNFIRSYGNTLTINGKIESTESEKLTDKTAVLALTNNYNITNQNTIILSYTFNGKFVKEIYLNSSNLENELTFTDSGVYDFYFSDLAGNKQMFKNNSYFRLYLLNDIVFKVNSNQAVDNAVFNESVTISLEQVNQFDRALVNIVSPKCNGKEIRVSKVNNTFTFSEYGLYQITLSGSINGNAVTTNYNFRIINLNEAMTTFEYVGLNNYEIVKVIKLDSKDSLIGDDITDYLKQQYDVNYLNSVALSTLENGIGGAGLYEIYVEARYSTSKIDQDFSFKVWLNNDTDVLIRTSIAHGEATTKPITISLNKSQIYNKIGECTIYYNDTAWIKIDSSSANDNATSSYTINNTGTYNIKIVTNSGNTLSSFVVTKNEPLNTVAIVVIVISVIAVGLVTFIFIRLRKNMKVK